MRDSMDLMGSGEHKSYDPRTRESDIVCVREKERERERESERECVCVHVPYMCTEVLPRPRRSFDVCPVLPNGNLDCLVNTACYGTVRHRGMGTEPMGTILRFASGVSRKIGTLLLGSWWT